MRPELKKFSTKGAKVMWMPAPYTSWVLTTHEDYNTMVLKEHLA